jgi:hypothetical protein
MNPAQHAERRTYPLLAWYRLWRLERDELFHFAFALSVLVLSFIFHALHIVTLGALVPVGVLVIAEAFLLWREFIARAALGDSTVVDESAFSAISIKLKSAELPRSFIYVELNFGKTNAGDDRPSEGILRSAEVDAWLLSEQPTIELILEKRGIENAILARNTSYLSEAFDYLLARLRRTGYPALFNESKVSLRTDLADTPGKAMVGRTSYIAGCLTNDACTRKLVRRTGTGDFTYADLTGMYPFSAQGDHVRALDLGESLLSNHIGISTIALFRQADGRHFVVLPIQSAKAAKSRRLYAPTGSGSLDWNDLERASRKDLLSIVTYGAERELCEEQGLVKLGASRGRLQSAIRPTHLRTIVLGHFRWMTHGGAPEFCCFSVATIDSLLTSIRPDEHELEAAGAAGALPQNPYSISSLDDLRRFCVDMRRNHYNDLSVPLIASLDLIDTALSRPLDDPMRLRLANFIEEACPGLRC